MPVARADLFTILNWIAAQGHSGAIAVAVLDLIFGESLLHYLDHVRFRKELIGPPCDILFRELFGSRKRIFHGQLLVGQRFLLCGRQA